MRMHSTRIPFIISIIFGVAFAQQGNFWPLPKQSSVGSLEVSLDPTSFDISCVAGSACPDLLLNAFKKYKQYIFFANQQNVKIPSVASSISLSVNATFEEDLGLDMDEFYTLDVDSVQGAKIQSNTQWGALRGLETFAQLVEWNYVDNTYSIPNTPVHVIDYPRFKWRGLLMDTARHYQPLRVIFRALDAMSWNKMNVFHWHIVDSQSFPYQSTTYPLLSQKGSWVPKAIYSPSDVQKVIQYAHDRGIRVIPEFDTPGHSASWGLGYPLLFPNCDYKNVFNPTTSYTLTFIQNFLTEISQVFPDQFMHLGGDEVGYDCWKQDPTITQWMKVNGISSYAELQAYYENKVQGIVDRLNKYPVFWEEVFDNSPPGTLNQNTIVNVWFSNTSKILEVVKAGFQTTFSTPWYLDRQIPDAETYYLWGDTWRDFYQADPMQGINLTPQERVLVLGGEASMWGEQVDETVFDERVWPRACAIAERLWSDQSVNNLDAATPRLGSHRCRMVQRGVNAGPIYPDYCETGKSDNYGF